MIQTTEPASSYTVMPATAPGGSAVATVTCSNGGCGRFHVVRLTSEDEVPASWECQECSGYVCPWAPGCTLDHRDDDDNHDTRIHWSEKRTTLLTSPVPHGAGKPVTADVQLFRVLHLDGSQAHPTMVELNVPVFTPRPTADARKLARLILAAADEADRLNADNPADGVCLECTEWIDRHGHPPYAD